MTKWLFLALLCAGAVFAQTIVQAEYFIGSDPGPGNGTPITIGSPSNNVPLAFTAATNALPSELTRVFLRVRDNSGRWSRAEMQFVVVWASAYQQANVATVEYRIDNGPYTLLNPADAPAVNINEVVATTGLTDGLHRLQIRAIDTFGRSGIVHDGFFVVSNTSGFSIRQVTHVEYWIDADAPTVVDVADAPQVSFNSMIASANLPIGLHFFNSQSRDNAGRIGKPHRVPLIVTSPFGPTDPRTVTAAEFFVNVDPGPGNGVPIQIPDDGAYDEAAEAVDTVITGLPVGLHRVGFRTRDNTGRWSVVTADSLIVGPVLVVRHSGNSAILEWQSGPGVDHFTIYRSTVSSGGFTQIATTAQQTYTDTNIMATDPRNFYYVTFTANGFSTYRFPTQREHVILQ